MASSLRAPLRALLAFGALLLAFLPGQAHGSPEPSGCLGAP